MRKWSYVISLLLVGAVALNGCGKKAPVADDMVDRTPPVESPADKPGGTPATPDTDRGDTAVDTAKAMALNDIFFDYNKSSLRDDAKRTLDANAQQMKGSEAPRVVIEGHCDERGTVEYNLALGQRRAHETMQYLISKGVTASRLSVISYGEERPIDPRHSEDAWSKNRRAHFVVQE